LIPLPCNQASKKSDPWALENSGSTRITPHQIQQMLLHAATLQYMSCKCHEITKWSWMCCCSAICQFVSPDFIIFATGMPNELCSIHGPNPRAPCFGHWQTHAAEP
jgi:hypothetical protein